MGNLTPKTDGIENLINININDIELQKLVVHFKMLLFDKCLSEGLYKYDLPHLRRFNSAKFAESLTLNRGSKGSPATGGSRKLRKKSKKISKL
jgi:hypothetical protein